MEITDIPTERSLKIKLGKEKTPILLQIPKAVLIYNDSSEEQNFVEFEYLYANLPIGRNYGIELYKQNNNNQLIRMKSSGKKIISKKDTLKLIFYTRHFLSEEINKEKLINYTKKMFEQKKDTLHIGTVVSFKQKHPKLFETLTQNDSISIQLLDGKKLGKRINVPVKW